MNTQTAVPDRLVVPHIKALVDSLAKNASAALVTLDRYDADNGKADLPEEVANKATNSSPWMSAMPANTASRFGKGGAFALVVLLHVVALYALSFMTPELSSVTPEPLQVISVAVPQAENDAPPLPAPVLRLPELPTISEPEINVAAVETTSITVAVRSEPTATTDIATGTPKVVSTVEYIREPSAKYPPAAKALKQRGTVMLRALVDATGHAREVNVQRSSGYRLLDDAARAAVLNALFKPYVENGQSHPMYVVIPIEFGASG